MKHARIIRIVTMDKFERDIIVRLTSVAGTEIFRLLSTCKGLHVFRAELTQFNTLNLYYAIINKHAQSRTYVANYMGSGRIYMCKIAATEGKQVAVWVDHESSQLRIDVAFSKDRPKDFYPFRTNMWIKRPYPEHHQALEAAFDNLLIGAHEFRSLVELAAVL